MSARGKPAEENGAAELQPLAGLSFASPPARSRDIGLKGELRWIPLSQLFIDPAYQRAILDSGKANIRRMIEEFSWLLFGTLTVGERGAKRYAVIDGQHRATAAKLHGAIAAAPCLVLRGGRADEARAFSAINGNVTRIHALQSFRAKVAAGDAAALRLVTIAARADVRFAGYPKQELDAGETMALGTVIAALKRYGENAVVAALTLLRAADSDAGLPASCVMGACSMMHKRGEWIARAEILGRKLAARGGAQALTAKALSRKATRGGPLWLNYEALLADAIVMAERTGGIPVSRLMAGK